MRLRTYASRASIWRYLILGLPPCALARCTDTTGPSLGPCSGSVTVTATASLSPTLSWTPNCLIDQLVIDEPLPPSVGGVHAVWAISARTPGEGAAAPLRYGTVPASMQESVAAEPLIMGHSYRIRISGSGAPVGEVPFTYWAPD
ncbi:MAG: hypothetical protein DMD45_04340 [Gemmatimonadetes bacterium]|nr:MAG: hypothetical protein DMD45_04340 [Gemmatimonadota bacterium]